MIEIEKTDRFDEWLARLRDRDAAAIVQASDIKVAIGLAASLRQPR